MALPFGADPSLLIATFWAHNWLTRTIKMINERILFMIDYLFVRFKKLVGMGLTIGGIVY